MRLFALRAFTYRGYPIVAACRLRQLAWLFLVCYAVESALAQTTPITPSGLNTQVHLSATPPAGTVQYDITGGTRPAGGVNLFHSFGDFNVPNNNIANFLNDSGLATSNILGRVTGGNISNIFGTIQATGFGNANLFLMNPTGFLFGPNATVNVGGMVAFTSADHLRLANGVLFNAIPNAANDALLSAAPVAAFGFLGSNPGAITVQGSQLSVTAGQSISLVGGNIAVQSGLLDDGTTVQPAGLSALGGQIKLASVASPGEILTGTLAQAPNINGQSFGNLSAIEILEHSLIDVSGNGGGTVLIRGGQFVLDNSTISANVTGPGPLTNGVESIGGGVDIQVSQDAVIQNGALIDTSVVGNATPGVTYNGVHIKADRIEVLGIADLDTGNFVPTVIQSNVAQGSTGGSSVGIELEANSVQLKDLVFLDAKTSGSGNAGSIVLKSTGNLEADGLVLITSDATASGSAGNIELTSTQGDILLTNAPLVTSQSLGSGTVGGIAVNAPNGDILLRGSPVFGPTVLFTHIDGTGFNEGKGGIQLTTQNLTIENSGIQIDNFSPDKPGGLTVNLTGILKMSGGDIFNSTLLTTTRGLARSADLSITAHDTLLTDGSQVATDTFGSGKAGVLNIFTDNLQITNGAQVRSSSRFNPVNFPGDPIITPSGAGGPIKIQGLASPAQSVLIVGQDSGIFTNTEGTGTGGHISVTANSVTLQNGGTLSAATSGTALSATGGTITVDASQVQLLTGGLITAATTGPGNAGSVTINTTDSVTIEGQVGFATPPLSATSRIITSTNGSGNGGDVTITAGQSLSITGNQDEISSNQSGIFTNTSGTGNAGYVNINADTLTLTSDAQIQANTLPGSEGRSGNIDVQVTQASLTGGSQILTNTVGLGDAGSIRIRADKSITLIDSTINNSSFDLSGNGAGNAGLIWLTAPTIALLHGNLISLSQGPGNAGNILLEGNTLATGIGSTTSSETIGPGRGGDITIRGLNGSSSRADDVTISGGSFVQSQTGGEGDAGDIDVMTERMALTDGSAMITAGAGGNAGNMKIDAAESVQISSFSLLHPSLLESDAFGTGNAGQITVITPSVTASDGGFISSSTTASGNASIITINATSVNLLNGGHLTSSTLNFDPESPEFAPTGNAGNVTVYGQAGVGSRATSVQIDGSGSGIFTDTQGTGVGGDIFVNANSITLQNGGTLSATTSGILDTATGGTITVDATNTVTMNSASITASSAGVADAGSINITSPNGFTMQSSTITTIAGQGAGGGNVEVITSPAATVLLQDSLISASVADGRGGGGNISIDPQFVILQNSQILAQAAQGQGGAITIIANLFLSDANSTVNADSGSGVNGTITIQSPNAPVSGQIQPLGKTPLIATSLLNQHCAALAGGQFSSFTVAGRDSLPTEPGSWLTSPLAFATLSEGMAPRLKAEGETADIQILSLRQIAPAGFLTQAFAVDRSAGCQS